MTVANIDVYIVYLTSPAALNAFAKTNPDGCKIEYYEANRE